MPSIREILDIMARSSEASRITDYHRRHVSDWTCPQCGGSNSPSATECVSCVPPSEQSSIVGQALEWLERIKAHQLTVVGEDIIDEYIHVRPAGKSAKDNLVTFVADGHNRWAGGARIINEHLRALGCESTLCTSSQAITKTRYIDTPFNQKVFSFCNRDEISFDFHLMPHQSKHLLIADFGHSSGNLPGSARFTSLMVQSNSLNWGFNLLTKYERADYIVCDEAELRLACQSRHGDIGNLTKHLAQRMGAKLIVVTLGHQGAAMWDSAEYSPELIHLPTYARKVVDRMGAGDAFLAASAPLAALGAPGHIVGLVGSVAAGLHVEKEGNPPLCREELIQRIKEIDVPQI